MSINSNAVFEGGGIRGIGHVGAACVFEKNGYQFENIAGSSAGAIVASLLVVGYNCDEIKEIMKDLDYESFKQKTLFDYLGSTGKGLNILFNYGIYSSSYFETWLHNLLAKKGKTTFGHIKSTNNICGNSIYKLQVTASDLTDKKLLVFPEDLKDFCINPDTYSIAKAVRMSMSIPVFYEPYRLKDCNGKEHLIVDGGLLSNYPMWIFDDGKSIPYCPTFGFKFADNPSTNSKIITKENRLTVFEYMQSIVATALDAIDKQYISESKGDLQRTTLIPTTVTVSGKNKNIGSTDFDITKDESEALFNNGADAAKKFLSTWSFEQWKNIYRKNKKIG